MPRRHRTSLSAVEDYQGDALAEEYAVQAEYDAEARAEEAAGQAEYEADLRAEFEDYGWGSTSGCGRLLLWRRSDLVTSHLGRWLAQCWQPHG